MIDIREQSTIHTGWGAPKVGGAPPEIAEAVELWAREHRGTHGKIVWNAVMKCWEIQFELKPDDPRMKRWRDGKLRVKPVEPVYLHRQKMVDGRPAPHYEGIPLEELGVEGVLAWLDEGNTWSGRGRHKSFDAACKAADAHNERIREMITKEAEENARLRARDERKRILGTPWTTVPALPTEKE